MVLPAPAPDTAPPAHAWLDRLSLVLRLAGRSVMVLIDRARPERLGELVRHLVRERPETAVLLDAPSLVTVAEGSTVVLCARAIDADWLNQERPIVQARSLRLVLFSEEETTLHLTRTAVDFYDWISHCIECPPGPPAFAVRALRRAACARPAAIVWQGGDLEGTFAEALPGRKIASVTATLPYPALVEALRPSAKRWIAVTDLDSPTRERRAGWAAAEAGRRGRLVLMDGVSAPLALPRVGARALTIEEGAARLGAAGVVGAARLAALLELSSGAIDNAAKLARAGTGEAELSALALREADPGPALECLARTQGLEGATGEVSASEEPSPRQRGRTHLGPFPRRIELALRASDLDVAAHWAEAWRKTTGSARSCAGLARVRFFQGAVGEAQRLLREARDQVANGTDDDTRLDLLRAEGLEYQAGGNYSKARPLLAEALGLAKRLERDRDEQDDLYNLLIQCLISSGHIKDAELTLHQWVTKRSVDGALTWDLPLAHATACLKHAQGDVSTAAHLLEQLLIRWPTEENHLDRTTVEVSLAQVWLDQGRFREAERILREAIRRLDQLGHPTTRLRHEIGRALHGLGRFREAEHEFRRVIEEAGPESTSVAPTCLELTRSLSAQGRLDEAEAFLATCLTNLRRDGLLDSRTYSTVLLEEARIQILRDELPRAEVMLREVLLLEETSRGREDPTLLQVLRDLSETLICLDRPAEAEPLLRRAVRLSEQAGDLAARARSLSMLAAAQAAQGFPQARNTARQSLEAWAATGSEVLPAHLRDLEAIVAGALSPRKAPSRRRQ